jgi:TatD DNase family protein
MIAGHGHGCVGYSVAMELIDIGANLTHESFASDLHAVLDRAHAAGVVQMVVTGASLEASAQALELARAHPGTLYATAGVHPHHAVQLHGDAADPSPLAALRRLLQAPEIVAVGECGLDYYRNFAPRAAQIQAFETQLALAAECGKPVFLHQRDAHADFMAILREHRRSLGAAVAHCFTGTRAEMEDCLALDLSIGLTGWICDERRGHHLHEVVRHIPAQRLLLETDAPYLLPRDLAPAPRSRRNEPAYLPHIARTVARARGETLEELAASSTAHAREFFRLGDAGDAPAG